MTLVSDTGQKLSDILLVLTAWLATLRVEAFAENVKTTTNKIGPDLTHVFVVLDVNLFLTSRHVVI